MPLRLPEDGDDEPLTPTAQGRKLLRHAVFAPIRSEILAHLHGLLRGRSLPSDIREELDECVQGIAKESLDLEPAERIAFLSAHTRDAVGVFVSWLDLREAGETAPPH